MQVLGKSVVGSGAMAADSRRGLLNSNRMTSASSGTWTSLWAGWMGVNFEQAAISRGFLRGGPSFQTEDRVSAWAGVSSDDRKRVQFNVTFFGNRRPENDSWSLQASPNLTWRPSGRARISLGTFYNRTVDDRQWVTRLELEQEEYVFARIARETVGLTGHVDYSLTPDLSLQLYTQSFVSSGAHTDFKRIQDPHGQTYADRFELLDTRIVDGAYHADVNGDGNFEYLGNPNFNFKQFRTNAVLRWEYRPGSTFFIVWSQGRNQFSPSGDFDFRSDLGTLFNAPTDNVLMVKFTYWLKP